MALRRFPGLIDVHVHLREPGATHKEDFKTGTRAAVKGGFTFVLDMPNNPIPTITVDRLLKKIALMKKKAVCDLGFHFGTNGKNITEFKKVMANPRVFGLKVYLNRTTGEMLVEDLGLLENVFRDWECDKPILVHAEGMQLAAAIGLARLYRRRLHVCHISQANEVELVRRAKKKRHLVSAGVCPHHLFLTGKDERKLGAFVMMKPALGTEKDQEALWEGLNDGTIDVVETDHAPHTSKEKKSKRPPFGVPGLETAVGLIHKAVEEKKIPRDLIIKLLYERPKRIFNIPNQKKTYIEVDTNDSWIVGEEGYETKCGWSPFEGWELPAKVKKVVLRGRTLLAGGKLVI